MIFKVARLLGLIFRPRLVLTPNLSCYEISFFKKNNGKKLLGWQCKNSPIVLPEWITRSNLAKHLEAHKNNYSGDYVERLGSMLHVYWR